MSLDFDDDIDRIFSRNQEFNPSGSRAGDGVSGPQPSTSDDEDDSLSNIKVGGGNVVAEDGGVVREPEAAIPSTMPETGGGGTRSGRTGGAYAPPPPAPPRPPPKPERMPAYGDDDEESQLFTNAKRSRRLSGPAVGEAVWNPAAGLRRSNTLPEIYRLPDKSECLMKGDIQRWKGKWVKKWHDETLVVQHNVLLFCSAVDPCLVKVCIPLRNVSGINQIKGNKKDPYKLQINFTQAGKKGKGKGGSIDIKCTSAENLKFWKDGLEKYRTICMRGTTPFSDFVHREDADRSLRSLHDTMKAQGLVSVCTRVYNLLGSKEQSLLEFAFAQLRIAAAHNIIEERGVEVQMIQEEMGQLENSTNHLTAVALLQRVYDAKLAHYFAFFQVKVAWKATGESMNTTGRLVGDIITSNEADYARHVVYWRKFHLRTTLRRLVSRHMREAFDGLRYAVSAHCATNELKRRSVVSILRMRQRQDESMLLRGLSRWNSYVRHRQNQLKSVSGLLTRHRQQLCCSALRRWRSTVVGLRGLGSEAVARMASVIHRNLKLRMGWAFRLWSWWSNELYCAQAMRIALNMNQVNNTLTSAYDTVPQDRSCFRFAGIILRVRTTNLQRAFNEIRAHSCRMITMKQAWRMLLHLHTTLKRRRLSLGLAALHRNNALGRMHSTAKRRAVVHWRHTIRQAQQRRQAHAWSKWRYYTIEMSMSRNRELIKWGQLKEKSIITMVKLVNTLESRRISSLFEGMQAFHINSKEVKLTRDLLRFHLFQGVLHIINRVRVAQIASAFALWRFRVTEYGGVYVFPLRNVATAIRRESASSAVRDRRVSTATAIFGELDDRDIGSDIDSHRHYGRSPLNLGENTGRSDRSDANDFQTDLAQVRQVRRSMGFIRSPLADESGSDGKQDTPEGATSGLMGRETGGLGASEEVTSPSPPVVAPTDAACLEVPPSHHERDESVEVRETSEMREASEVTENDGTQPVSTSHVDNNKPGDANVPESINAPQSPPRRSPGHVLQVDNNKAGDEAEPDATDSAQPPSGPSTGEFRLVGYRYADRAVIGSSTPEGEEVPTAAVSPVTPQSKYVIGNYGLGEYPTDFDTGTASRSAADAGIPKENSSDYPSLTFAPNLTPEEAHLVGLDYALHRGDGSGGEYSDGGSFRDSGSIQMDRFTQDLLAMLPDTDEDQDGRHQNTYPPPFPPGMNVADALDGLGPDVSLGNLDMYLPQAFVPVEGHGVPIGMIDSLQSEIRSSTVGGPETFPHLDTSVRCTQPGQFPSASSPSNTGTGLQTGSSILVKGESQTGSHLYPHSPRGGQPTSSSQPSMNSPSPKRRAPQPPDNTDFSYQTSQRSVPSPHATRSHHYPPSHHSLYLHLPDQPRSVPAVDRAESIKRSPSQMNDLPHSPLHKPPHSAPFLSHSPHSPQSTPWTPPSLPASHSWEPSPPPHPPTSSSFPHPCPSPRAPRSDPSLKSAHSPHTPPPHSPHTPPSQPPHTPPPNSPHPPLPHSHQLPASSYQRHPQPPHSPSAMSSSPTVPQPSRTFRVSPDTTVAIRPRPFPGSESSAGTISPKTPQNRGPSDSLVDPDSAATALWDLTLAVEGRHTVDIPNTGIQANDPVSQPNRGDLTHNPDTGVTVRTGLSEVRIEASHPKGERTATAAPSTLPNEIPSFAVSPSPVRHPDFASHPNSTTSLTSPSVIHQRALSPTTSSAEPMPAVNKVNDHSRTGTLSSSHPRTHEHSTTPQRRQVFSQVSRKGMTRPTIGEAPRQTDLSLDGQSNVPRAPTFQGTNQLASNPIASISPHSAAPPAMIPSFSPEELTAALSSLAMSADENSTKLTSLGMGASHPIQTAPSPHSPQSLRLAKPPSSLRTQFPLRHSSQDSAASPPHSSSSLHQSVLGNSPSAIPYRTVPSQISILSPSPVTTSPHSSTSFEPLSISQVCSRKTSTRFSGESPHRGPQGPPMDSITPIDTSVINRSPSSHSRSSNGQRSPHSRAHSRVSGSQPYQRSAQSHTPSHSPRCHSSQAPSSVLGSGSSYRNRRQSEKTTPITPPCSPPIKSIEGKRRPTAYTASVTPAAAPAPVKPQQNQKPPPSMGREIKRTSLNGATPNQLLGPRRGEGDKRKVPRDAPLPSQAVRQNGRRSKTDSYTKSDSSGGTGDMPSQNISDDETHQKHDDDNKRPTAYRTVAPVSWKAEVHSGLRESLSTSTVTPGRKITGSARNMSPSR
eukprot:GHVN01052868.1.p1 GENE.GHVN01052868.1~~GHVN01052868.1.p1  ORF type:complete len:2207 (+),score=504.80 GHVN01052868.1:386-7006(+)